MNREKVFHEEVDAISRDDRKRSVREIFWTAFLVHEQFYCLFEMAETTLIAGASFTDHDVQ